MPCAFCKSGNAAASRFSRRSSFAWRMRASASSDGVCACDLEGVLDLSQPTVSHHMRQLLEAGDGLGRRAHLLQRFDVAVDEVQQRLDGERRPEERRGRSDAATTGPRSRSSRASVSSTSP